jgi:DNA-directed RNA polymerase specialized sigma24 family protein
VSNQGDDPFAQFVQATEPRLHRALVAKLGWELGREATAEALAYAWEHWARLAVMENPAGYLYRVGASRIRPAKTRVLFEQSDETSFSFEPDLRRALEVLPERQRIAVVLIHGYGWTSAEVADMTGVRPSTIQTHLARGLASLRGQLKVEGKEHA